jgi:hypothetical protein
MKKFLILSLMVSITYATISQEILKVDPNHLEDGGYGYLISADQTCYVWWAEGAYKVMKDAPVPTKNVDEIKIWSAKNEFESFIIVIHPLKRMENFRIKIPELKDNNGNSIKGEEIIIRKVEYVKVLKPTDSYGYKGWWPDPLPVYEKPGTIFPNENQPFWITVNVPANSNAGVYSGEVVISSGNWKLSVPVTLNVWDFELPVTPSMRSGFGLFFNTVKDGYFSLIDPLNRSY